jgi:hypothetical protein
MQIESLRIPTENKKMILKVDKDIIVLNQLVLPFNASESQPKSLPKGVELEDVLMHSEVDPGSGDRHDLKILGLKEVSKEGAESLSRTLGKPKRRTVKRRSLAPKLSRKKVISDVIKFELELAEIEEQLKEPRLTAEELRHAKDLVRIEEQERELRDKLRTILQDFGSFLQKNKMIPDSYEDLISKEYQEVSRQEYSERLSGDVQMFYDMQRPSGDWDSSPKQGPPTSPPDLLLLYLCQNLQIDPRVLDHPKNDLLKSL